MSHVTAMGALSEVPVPRKCCGQTSNAINKRSGKRYFIGCDRPVVWLIGQLQFCSLCYDRYWETHDVNLDLVKRLSDVDSDFRSDERALQKRPLSHWRTA